MLLRDEDIKLLSDNNWYVEIENFIVVLARNTQTGCKISGAHAMPFIFEVLEELREEMETPFLSEEQRIQILEYRGYQVVCESPLEIIDPFNNMITGQCAKYVLSTVVA